jgi:hypothetical protein
VDISGVGTREESYDMQVRNDNDAEMWGLGSQGSKMLGDPRNRVDYHCEYFLLVAS